MHCLRRASIAVLVTVGLLIAGGMASASPVLNSAKFSSLQAGDDSPTSSIVNYNYVRSAYFAPGTPTGAVSINVTQAGRTPYLRTAHVYLLGLAAEAANNGTITINGHEFVITTAQTIADVIQAINNANIDVAATWDVVNYRVILTDVRGLGCFSYAETTDILNGGAGNDTTEAWSGARAVITYADGSTEIYSSEGGWQLIGDTRHGIINLTVAGGTVVANLGHCIDIVPQGPVECASYLTSVIKDRTHVASASFAPCTVEGPVKINLPSAATKASLTMCHLYPTDTPANIANNGTITINGHAFIVTTSNTVANVVSMINTAGTGVTATWNSAIHKAVLTDTSGYGSNHSFTYAETADILNGGNAARVTGCDADAWISYSNGFTEHYGCGKGLQLIGNVRGGVINLTEAGNHVTHYHDPTIVPASLIGYGDAVRVKLDVSDDSSITSITCPSTGPLVHASGSVWTGSLTAPSTAGNQMLTFTVTDSAGASTLTAAYTTVPCLATNIGSIYHAIMDGAATQYLYTVCGKVASVDPDGFCVNDGSWVQVKVVGGGSSCKVGDHVMVRGQLDMGASPHVLVAHSVKKVE